MPHKDDETSDVDALFRSERTRACMVDFVIGLMCAVSTVIIVALISIVVTTSQSMQASSDAIVRITIDASAHLDAQLYGIGVALDSFEIAFASAMATPRIPTASEMSCYGPSVRSYPSHPNVSVFATWTDFGGPSAVLYEANLYNNSTSPTYDAIIEKLFIRTGGLGCILKGIMQAWNGTVLDVFSKINAYLFLYPFQPLFRTYLYLPNNTRPLQLNPIHNPFRLQVWTDPYRDRLTGVWMVTASAPVYDIETDAYLGVAGFDISTAQFLTYAEDLSTSLPFSAYVVIASQDGTLLEIPSIGAKDWAPEYDNFNYTKECQDTMNYNQKRWNFFQNPDYIELASLICAGNMTYCAISSGQGKVSFNGTSVRLISWNWVERAKWIVLVVVDQQSALHEQRKAKTMVLLVSILLGCVVVISAMFVAVYAAFQLKLFRIGNKIDDSHVEMRVFNSSRECVQCNSGGDKITELVSSIKKSNETKQHRSAIAGNWENFSHSQIQLLHLAGIDLKEQSAGECKNKKTPSEHWSQVLTANSPSIDIDITSWRFNVLEVETKSKNNGSGENSIGLLPMLTIAVIKHWNLDYLPIDLNKLLEFVSRLDKCYCFHQFENPDSSGNPYHNKMHAAAVTHSLFYLIDKVRQASATLRSLITPMELFACLLTALIHDYGHPGRNNSFLASTQHKIFIQHGESALERFHIHRAFELLWSDPDCMALSSMPRSQQLELHSLCTSLVLATDMAKHVAFLKTFNSWSTQSEEPLSRPIDGKIKLLILQILVKAADLSDSFREWNECEMWSLRQMEEFHAQEEDECTHKICSQAIKASAAQIQSTFIPAIVIPLIHSISKVFPDLKHLEEQAFQNFENWNTQLEN
ncbi:cAMP-specific 3',5'-cAMP phosphodiesterase 4 [Pelomyxa schiedti]|nr:cAMP-specific 3',5'-cAMP phosphodiesterase 4 [Pelomyxa schiedti]